MAAMPAPTSAAIMARPTARTTLETSSSMATNAVSASAVMATGMIARSSGQAAAAMLRLPCPGPVTGVLHRCGGAGEPGQRRPGLLPQFAAYRLSGPARRGQEAAFWRPGQEGHRVRCALAGPPFIGPLVLLG